MNCKMWLAGLFGLGVVASGWAASTTYTPTSAGWGEALTVAADDTVTLVGASDRVSVWQGAVTVNAGGTLKTTGRVRIVGTTTVQAGASGVANGKIDVESGELFPTLASQTMSGDLYIRAGATFHANISDGLRYNDNAPRVYVWGTFDCGTVRQTIGAADRVYFYDGSSATGVGDGNGGFDSYQDNCRFIFQGKVAFDTPFRSRTAGQTVQFAFCEGAEVAFTRGFGNGAGACEFVAATQGEGNSTGTLNQLTTTIVDLGSSTSLIKPVGTVTFVPAGTSQLKVEINPPTAMTVVTDHTKLLPARALMQTLPLMTGTGAVRLTGDALVSIPVASTAVFTFDGPSLCLPQGAPLALSEGTTFLRPLTIIANDLPTGSTTLLTGAGAAALDPATVTVKPGHRGIPLAASFAAAKVEDAIVVNDVTAYSTGGWVEPFLAARALIWLDAADADNFVFKDGTLDKVVQWKDKSACARHANAYTIPSHSANWGGYGVAAGVPAFLMGELNSGIDLSYTRMTTIRTAFFAMSIRNGGGCLGFWLGDTSVYDFHRGGAGQYSYTGGANPNNTWYCDGVKIADTKNTSVPTDRHVYSCTTRANLNSDRLTCDRNCDTYGRHGGRELSELICLDEELGDADRQAIEAYLAAKWMGANPTAGQTTIAYHIDEALTVTGSHEGTVPLTFGDGAEIVVDQPSATAPMLKTTGAVTVEGTVKVTINATRLGAGTYTVIEGGAGSNLPLSAFTASILPGANLAANLAIEDGKLVLKVVEAASSTLLWRPSGTDLTWSTDIVNWLDGETATAFMPGKNVRFDGQDATQGPIVVNDQFTVGTWTMEGAKDYTFTGTGTLEGLGATTLGGTGTVTLNGPNLGGQDLVIKDGRKVVLGADAGPDALGTTTSAGGGTVKIEAGGQFNLNFTSTANADMRNEITHKKDFLIAGDGPDGRGAIVSDSLDGRSLHTTWNCVLRRVELTGDATVSGTDRFDVRALSGTSSTSAGGVFGPDKRLTVKATGIFGIISLPIDLGAITVTEGGIFRPESPTSVSIPGGVTLDNGILHGYSTTFPATVPFNVTERGGTIDVENGTTTINGPLTIPENATLTLTGASTSYTGVYNGAVTNNGMISVVNGIHKFAGPAVGDFNISVTGGNFYFAKGFTGEHINLTTASVGVYVADGVKFDTMDVSNGFFSFKTDSLAGPEFNAVNLTSESTSFDVLPQANGIADVKGPVYVNKTGGTMFVYGPNNTAEHGMALELHGYIETCWVGLNSNRAGTLEVKPGSDVTINNFRTGQGGSGASKGRFIVDKDAKVKITAGFTNGDIAGTPGVVSDHTTEVFGELDMTGIVAYNGYQAPRAQMFLREGGVLKLAGMRENANANFAYGSGAGAGDGRQWFKMEGGYMEIGASGLEAGYRTPGVQRYDFANGTIKNTAAWGTTYCAQAFFGHDELGGTLEFDLGEYLVNWNTGIAGTSDLILKGTANFQGDRKDDRIQGAMLGKVTVESTGVNDLKPVSVFGGGLKLASGVSAQVASYGDEKYLASVGGTVMDNLNGTAWSYEYTSANFFPFFHKWQGDENAATRKPYANETCITGRGEFYVPANQAGVWTFCGCYDDYVSLYVDGAKVFTVTTKCAVGSGKVTLTEGWHTFSVLVGDSTGGCGPSGTGWKDVMALGFHVGETTSTTPTDYLKFAPGIPFGDGTNLQIRPYANACIWSYQNGNGNWDTTENWSHVKAMKSVDYMHKYSGMSDAGSYSQWFAGKANKFEGWMKVEDGKEGEWTFKMGYDDNKRLRIDGVDVINHVGDWANVYSGKKTLTPGWHRWEVRVQDGSGGWGPNGVNNYNTLSYIAPGESEKQFNETNLKLAATLGDISVLERTGIYRELDVGENATLTSLGTETMPIFGTLKGKGWLIGSFAFEGPASAWEVEGICNRRLLTSVAKIADATKETYTGLGKVVAKFDERPKNPTYELATAPSGLAAADLAGVATDVKDANGVDFSSDFFVSVRGGKIVLVNLKPSGFSVFIR